MEPGPVVYNVAQLKHPTFSRAGADLVHVARLPLIDGLCGAALRIPTLDGRTLDIPVSDVVDSGARKVVVGEGMARGDGTRGDLIIVFDLVFPRTLSRRSATSCEPLFLSGAETNPGSDKGGGGVSQRRERRRRRVVHAGKVRRAFRGVRIVEEWNECDSMVRRLDSSRARSPGSFSSSSRAPDLSRRLTRIFWRVWSPSHPPPVRS